MTMIKRRKIEIIAFERERVIVRVTPLLCPMCQRASEWLTVAQAATLAQVKTRSIRRWLAQGKAHSVSTAGGQRRVCRDSLFII